VDWREQSWRLGTALNKNLPFYVVDIIKCRVVACRDRERQRPMRTRWSMQGPFGPICLRTHQRESSVWLRKCCGSENSTTDSQHHLVARTRSHRPVTTSSWTFGTLLVAVSTTSLTRWRYAYGVDCTQKYKTRQWQYILYMSFFKHICNIWKWNVTFVTRSWIDQYNFCFTQFFVPKFDLSVLYTVS